MNVGKWKMLGLAAALVDVVGSSVLAAEDRPSQALLEQMGLGGMVVMSDADGMSVRGHGFQGGRSSSVRVFGNSFATINGRNGGAHSENGYVVEGKHFAAGANGSVAGVIHTSSGGRKGGSYNRPKSSSKFGGRSGGMGGGYGGGVGGGTRVRSTTFFAGGFSVGFAH
jgi:hypothetical protein